MQAPYRDCRDNADADGVACDASEIAGGGGGSFPRGEESGGPGRDRQGALKLKARSASTSEAVAPAVKQRTRRRWRAGRSHGWNARTDVCFLGVSTFSIKPIFDYERWILKRTERERLAFF